MCWTQPVPSRLNVPQNVCRAYRGCSPGAEPAGPFPAMPLLENTALSQKLLCKRSQRNGNKRLKKKAFSLLLEQHPGCPPRVRAQDPTCDPLALAISSQNQLCGLSFKTVANPSCLQIP